MGFQVKRSLNIGGVRLNLSNVGISASAGLKGFRIGMSGKGTYVHMGAGGLYYRKRFSWSEKKHNHEQISEPEQSELQNTNLLQPIEVESSTADISHVLEHFKPYPISSTFILVIGLLSLFAISIHPFGYLFLLVFAALFAINFLSKRKVLFYDIDSEKVKVIEEFVNSFEEFMDCKKLWLYENSTVTYDWKRNAGASSLITRKNAKFSIAHKMVKSNISIPCINAGKDKLFFLPDMIVCVSGGSVSGFRYQDANVKIQSKEFVEEEGTPSDAKIVNYTWRYVNKDGGPDRRFSNNARFPVCAYQQVNLALAKSHIRVISKSKEHDHSAFISSFETLKSTSTSFTQIQS